MALNTKSRARRGRSVPEPLIGSYLLESITTGMYGERRNAIREYIQNSFDGIQAAIESRALREGSGKIIVTLSDDRRTLKILDNGAGLSRRTAVDTLTAVGASKKVRGHAAGFRGIGRLAGVAFSSTLEFRTKAAGEDSETVVTFDCDELKRGMLSSGRRPAAELIAGVATYDEVPNAQIRKSFFEVTLRGLKDAPVEATDSVQLANFLSQVAPVDFHPEFSALGAQIYEKADEAATEIDERSDDEEDEPDFDDSESSEDEEADEYEPEEHPPVDWTFLDEDMAGTMLERVPTPHVQLFIKKGEKGSEVQLFKPYRPKHGIAGSRSVAVSNITVYVGPSRAWWGWVGLKTKPGEYEEQTVAGLRLRLKNIQIDGNDLIQMVPDTNRIRSSFGRWSNWFVGEIHLDPRAVIPNARRDNFEEDERWAEIRREITEVCVKLTSEARRVSKNHQLSLEVIEGKIERHREAFVKVSHAPKFDLTKANRLVTESDKLQRSLEKASEGAPVGAQVRFKALTKELTAIKVSLLAKPKDGDSERYRAAIRQEFLQKTLAIVADYLSISDFDEVKLSLEKALK